MISLCVSKWPWNGMYILTQFDWLLSWYGNNSLRPCTGCNLLLLSSLLHPISMTGSLTFPTPRMKYNTVIMWLILYGNPVIRKIAESCHSDIHLFFYEQWCYPTVDMVIMFHMLAVHVIWAFVYVKLANITYTRADSNKEWFVHSAVTFDYTLMNCELMQMFIVWVSEFVSIRQLYAMPESLGSGVIDRTMMSEDWMRKELDIQPSSVHSERSEGLVLFFLIAPSLTHMANEHIQSMARPSRTSGTAFYNQS